MANYGSKQEKAERSYFKALLDQNKRLLDQNIATFDGGVYLKDSASVDSFGRLRVANTDQRLDVEFIYDTQIEYFDKLATGTGTITHNANTRDITLAVGATSASSSRMSSFPVPYTPGNSQIVEMTGVLNLANLAGGTTEVFLRSSISGSVTEQVIPQSQWLTNNSNINWNNSHIFVMDFQSLKVGRIRFGLNNGGNLELVATIENNNIRNSGYWQNPSLPVMYKIHNDAGESIMEIAYGNEANAIGFRFKAPESTAASMKAICCTVKSEGGGDLRDLPGLPRVIDTGVTTQTVSTTLVPILAIRPKQTFKAFDNLSIALPKDISLQPTNSVKLVIIHDAILTGASWQDVDTVNSAMEYDVAATAVAGGEIIHSEYIFSNSSGPASSTSIESNKSFLGKTPLWNRQDSSLTGILAICAIRTGASDAECLASISWEEIR